MTRQGSFFPLRPEMPSADPVLFAYVVNTPQQREALHDEILARITAVQEISEALAAAQFEAPHARSHRCLFDAVAILSRDVRGLIEASIDRGP